MGERPKTVGDISLDDPGTAFPGVIDVSQGIATSSPFSEAMGMVTELYIKVRIQDGLNFPQGHTIRHFLGDPTRHCAMVAVDTSIGLEIQLSIEKVSIHALKWQTTSASFTENS